MTDPTNSNLPPDGGTPRTGPIGSTDRPAADPDPVPMLGDALSGLLRGVLSRSRTEVERLASDGRARLELRQLRKDRLRMYGKLGKETRALLEAGEIEHPGLARGVGRISELDERIAAAEAAFAATGEPVPADPELDEPDSP